MIPIIQHPLTGRHRVAALCLGASGVWTGTLWLASRESGAGVIIDLDAG